MVGRPGRNHSFPGGLFLPESQSWIGIPVMSKPGRICRAAAGDFTPLEFTLFF
jgi:hypothetical protein